MRTPATVRGAKITGACMIVAAVVAGVFALQKGGGGPDARTTSTGTQGAAINSTAPVTINNYMGQPPGPAATGQQQPAVPSAEDAATRRIQQRQIEQLAAELKTAQTRLAEAEAKRKQMASDLERVRSMTTSQASNEIERIKKDMEASAAWLRGPFSEERIKTLRELEEAAIKEKEVKTAKEKKDRDLIQPTVAICDNFITLFQEKIAECERIHAIDVTHTLPEPPIDLNGGPVSGSITFPQKPTWNLTLERTTQGDGTPSVDVSLSLRPDVNIKVHIAPIQDRCQVQMQGALPNRRFANDYPLSATGRALQDILETAFDTVFPQTDQK